MNPDTIIGGIAAVFEYTFENYDADDGCSISAKLVGGGAQTDVSSSNAEGDGTAWTLTIPAATTTALTAGSYTLLVLATDGTTEQVVINQSVKIIAAAATDMRSNARQILEALEATLLSKASKDQLSISYEGRSISRMSLEDIQKAIARQKRIVKAEEDTAAGKKKIKTASMRFVNA